MKRTLILWLTWLMCLPALLLSGGCKHHTIIPDEELAMIFHDAFLANSFLQSTDARRDSLLVYEPIFERYGYTAEDMHYTIGNFSKRKSARLGDVVELAIARLESEGLELNRIVAGLDTVNNVARRSSERVIRHDTLIRVTSLKDTAQLRIVLDSVRPGDYRIHTRYMVDSLDKNTSLRMQLWMEPKTGGKRGLVTQQYRREYEETFERTLTVDTSIRSIVCNFWHPGRGKRHRPHVTLSDLKIYYTLPTAEAVDSLYERQLDIRIFADEFLRIAAPDSVALPLD